MLIIFSVNTSSFVIRLSLSFVLVKARYVGHTLGRKGLNVDCSGL